MKIKAGEELRPQKILMPSSEPEVKSEFWESCAIAAMQSIIIHYGPANPDKISDEAAAIANAMLKRRNNH